MTFGSQNIVCSNHSLDPRQRAPFLGIQESSALIVLLIISLLTIIVIPKGELKIGFANYTTWHTSCHEFQRDGCLLGNSRVLIANCSTYHQSLSALVFPKGRVPFGMEYSCLLTILLIITLLVLLQRDGSLLGKSKLIVVLNIACLTAKGAGAF